MVVNLRRHSGQCDSFFVEQQRSSDPHRILTALSQYRLIIEALQRQALQRTTRRFLQRLAPDRRGSFAVPELRFELVRRYRSGQHLLDDLLVFFRD
ncbi:hypothetical protein ACFX2I_011462 [Malus domestica]